MCSYLNSLLASRCFSSHICVFLYVCVFVWLCVSLCLFLCVSVRMLICILCVCLYVCLWVVMMTAGLLVILLVWMAVSFFLCVYLSVCCFCMCYDAILIVTFLPVSVSCFSVSVCLFMFFCVLLCACSYDDGWLSGYPPHMGPPMGRGGGRFIRPPGPPLSGRGTYRTSGKFTAADVAYHNL